jgi:MFS family permease
MLKRILLIVVLLYALTWSVGAIMAQDATTVPDSAEEVADDIVDATTAAAEATATSAQNLLDRLLIVPTSPLARVLLVAGGLVLLLAGWRVYEYIILIAGFLIGAASAASLLVSDTVIINIIVLLIGGLIGVVLSALIYPIAVFIIGAYVGIALTAGLASAFGLAPASSIALLLGGLVGGLVLISLSFQFLILLSAVVGAQILTIGLGLPVVWVLLFAIVGIIVQLSLVRALDYDYRSRPRYIRLFARR